MTTREHTTQNLSHQLIHGDAFDGLRRMPDGNIDSIASFVNRITCGEVRATLKRLPNASVDCVVTSPPYWSLRDYGAAGQLGQEPTLEEYVGRLADVFDEVRRVLKPTGTCWVNLGDSFVGAGAARHLGGVDPKKRKLGPQRHAEPSGLAQSVPAKCLAMIPSRFAIEMTRRGWILRNEIIWWKPNAMPSSVTDRFTVDFEKLFLFVKSKQYWFLTQYEPYAPSSDVRYHQALRARKVYDIKAPYRANTAYAYKAGQGAVRSRGTGPCHLVVGGGNASGRIKRSVWRIPTRPYRGSHVAVFPPELLVTPITAGCPKAVCRRCGTPRAEGGRS